LIQKRPSLFLEKANISVRSFAWHDILKFYRYRRQVLCTDSTHALTRGNSIGPWAFITRLNPSVDVFTAVCLPGDGQPPLIGQMKYTSGQRSARIVSLMPESALDQPHLPDLLEMMASRAGACGAFHLLAEVDEDSSAMEGIRRAGFAVYGWQRIWQFRFPPENHRGGAGVWQPATSLDEIPIRNLYQSLVPPLVQSAEPLTARRPHGWVYHHDDEIMAYVEGIYGPRGIYLQPLIHPAVENVSQVVSALLSQQPRILNRPVYIAIRSYQAWLETVVGDLECQVGPRQALMVKHLVAQQRVSVITSRHSVLEKYTAEPTVPLVQNSVTHPE
jgi:hypothetical protein